MAAEKRPGVMLYFADLRPAFRRLSMEQRGVLFTQIFDYAENGTLPDELDDLTGLCFDLMREKIDRDGERYKSNVLQRKYAVYCREQDKAGRERAAFDEWEREQSVDIG